MYNVIKNDKFGVAARESSLAESYRENNRIQITKGKIVWWLMRKLLNL